MSSYLQEVARNLVAHDTVSHNSNAEAMDYLSNCLDGHGFTVTLQVTEVGGVMKSNLVATAGPPEEDGLILSGHVDTVPFVDQPGWTREPLSLEVEDDRVYGRGTSDMKVFLAQCVDAAAQIGAAAGARFYRRRRGWMPRLPSAPAGAYRLLEGSAQALSCLDR